MTIPGGTERSAGGTATATRSCRPVTLVFSDLEGSTALAERLEPETLRAVTTRYFDDMREIFERHGGAVAKIIGDAIVTVFDAAGDAAGAARRATGAAIEASTALAELNEDLAATWGVRLRHRTGVATGELAAAHVPGPGVAADVLAGDVVTAAESLESSAPPMEVLVDAATRRLVDDPTAFEALGPVLRKGGSGTIDAWRLLGVRGQVFTTGSPAAGASGPCPWCTHVNGAQARRCASCSAVLTSAVRSRESRRTVTIVFADPKPSTFDGTRPEAGVTHAVMTRYFAVMRPIVERHGGTTERFIGDALMAVFGLPVRHEDDAIRAVRAAAEMRTALAALNDELGTQLAVVLAGPIGINTGTVVATGSADGQRLVTGDAVNVAARLQQAAGVGEVLVGGTTRRLVGARADVEPVAALSLRGKTDAVPAFRLVGVSDAAAANVDSGHHAPLVGRTAELEALRAAFDEATSTGRAVRTTLLGDPGAGKSRLTSELLAGLPPDARVVRGGCLAYGDGITFWPLLRVVHQAAGIEEADDAATARARIASLMPADADLIARVQSLAGLDETPFVVAELVWAMRRLLEHLAATAPLVVVVDDVHWAESTLLQALDDLTQSLEAPVLLLCTSRLDLTDEHRTFVDGASTVTLAPLPDVACRALLRTLLGGTHLPDRQVGAIVDAAGGNPLFLEQLLSMLVDEGRLLQEDGRWRVVGRLSALSLPASLEGLVAARLDQLPTDERDVIQPASVIGLRFVQDAIEHLVPRSQRATAGTSLEALGQRGLVAAVEGEPSTFRFENQLIRDATYRCLLKEARAALHEHFVAWADEVNAARDRRTEFEEITGYHLEQAHRYWRELGPLDDHAVAVGMDAFRRLSSAGERALARGDMPAASSLFFRAAALLPNRHEEKARTLLRAGNALHEIGAFGEAGDAYDASAAAAVDAGDDAGVHGARVERLRLDYLIGRVPDGVRVDTELQRALASLDELGDADALSRAWQLQLNIEIAGCRWAGAQEAAERVIACARRAGNELLETRTMPLMAFLALKGPMPVPQATRYTRELLARVSLDRRSSGLVQLELATLSAMALDVDGARALYGETRAVLDELGWEMQGALVSLSSGPIELLAGDPVRAEQELRRDYDALEAMSERNFISLTATLLAEALFRQGRLDEARHFADVGGALADPDDVAVQILVRSVVGKLTALDGDGAGGVALCREAVRLIAPTEDPSGEGDALLDLGVAMVAAGDRSAARDAAIAAGERYCSKGNIAGVRRARAFTSRLGAAP